MDRHDYKCRWCGSPNIEWLSDTEGRCRDCRMKNTVKFGFTGYNPGTDRRQTPTGRYDWEENPKLHKAPPYPFQYVTCACGRKNTVRAGGGQYVCQCGRRIEMPISHIYRGITIYIRRPRSSFTDYCRDNWITWKDNRQDDGCLWFQYEKNTDIKVSVFAWGLQIAQSTKNFGDQAGIFTKAAKDINVAVVESDMSREEIFREDADYITDIF